MDKGLTSYLLGGGAGVQTSIVLCCLGNLGTRQTSLAKYFFAVGGAKKAVVVNKLQVPAIHTAYSYMAFVLQ